MNRKTVLIRATVLNRRNGVWNLRLHDGFANAQVVAHKNAIVQPDKPSHRRK